MALADWLSLAFLVVAAGGAAAYAGVRGWRTYKTFRALTGAAARRLDEIMARAGVAEDHALAASRAVERLSAAVARLQESLAHLAVLRAAAAESRAALTFRLPKK